MREGWAKIRHLFSRESHGRDLDEELEAHLEMEIEANRQDRSLSWIVQKAWKIAREEISKYPAVNDSFDDDDSDNE